MPALLWKHGRSRAEVHTLIQSKIDSAGVGNSVTWTGDEFRASVGWGTVLNLVGEITDDEIILHRSTGALGSVVISKARDAFQELFPGGEQSIEAIAKSS